jgi:hypothetical protein
MWKANGKTTTLQLFLDSLSPKNMRDASSGDSLKNALFGELSLKEAMDLSRDRQILDLTEVIMDPQRYFRNSRGMLFFTFISKRYPIHR